MTIETVETPKKRLFKSRYPSMNYVFKTGTIAAFKFSMFTTTKESEIAELEDEISKGHPTIYMDPKMMYLTPEMEDPMKALRAKIIAEHMAEVAAKTSHDNDMGTSEPGKFRAENTRDVASVAAGGDATQTATAAKLVALAKDQASRAK